MKNKLIYQGKLRVTPPLSDQEVEFLNAWQECMKLNFEKISSSKTVDKDKNKYYDIINSFIGLPLNKEQLWLLEYSFNPLIKFENRHIIIEGESVKGQLRDALMLYQFFFFDQDGFMKRYLKDLPFTKSHTFSGIIQSEKYDEKGHSQWCYIAKKSDVYSVNASTIEEYKLNPNRYPKQLKTDNTVERMNEYYPDNSPVLRFVHLNNTLETKNIKIKQLKI